MIIFDYNIPDLVTELFSEIDIPNRNINSINLKVKNISGIDSFFKSNDELNSFYEKLDRTNGYANEDSRAEYGDFQTNSKLAENICKLLKKQGINPDLIIEPTCGKGNFLISPSKFILLSFSSGLL